jgi:hypothetical protein
MLIVNDVFRLIYFSRFEHLAGGTIRGDRFKVAIRIKTRAIQDVPSQGMIFDESFICPAYFVIPVNNQEIGAYFTHDVIQFAFLFFQFQFEIFSFRYIPEVYQYI